MERIRNFLWFLAILAAFTISADVMAYTGTSSLNKSEPPGPGIYFYQLEPSFYTGFAPRCQEPERIQVNLGRGNQLRITVVLSDQIIDEYLSDLTIRYQTYSELINTGQITLSQNLGFEEFKKTIMKEDIVRLESQKGTVTSETYRETSLELLKKLNPGKIFHIRIDFPDNVRRWSEQLKGYRKSKLLVNSNLLELVNDMLPTRLKLTEMSPQLKDEIISVIKVYEAYEQSGQETAWDTFYNASVKLFTTVTQGVYPLKDNRLDFYEFTAIYPVGTLNEFARYDGVEMPLYPCPGKRVLHVHQRTKVVDHIPEVACYSYNPWIPYMHVGKKLHNSFHTLWFRINLKRTSFIPDNWKQNNFGSRTGKTYPYLWLVSRGPMSHGCTHVNAGHISELRQLFPSKEEDLRKVVTFRNKSNHFDVFDINGDGEPEVMGVRYYYAYSLKNKKPYKLRAGTDRKSFYKWLYRKGYSYDEHAKVVFEQVSTSAFEGNKAVKGKTYSNIVLYEAPYFPEKIQFYKLKDIDFVRELRRVSSTYNVNRKVLGLKAHVQEDLISLMLIYGPKGE
jgi:hypothetical protein